jgi:hypothetical protein
MSVAAVSSPPVSSTPPANPPAAPNDPSPPDGGNPTANAASNQLSPPLPTSAPTPGTGLKVNILA